MTSPNRSSSEATGGLQDPSPAPSSLADYIDRQTKLTGNQYRIIIAAIVSDMLEYFDMFLIGFVLSFIIKPWSLTSGEAAVILLSSGVGAIVGAFIWGYIADRVGRLPTFIATVLNFSLATGALALTYDNAWIYLSFFRFLTGVGVGGLMVIAMPLAQEFVPTRMRGFVGGIVTAFIPLGIMLGALCGAFAAPIIGWRGLFVIGLLPAALTLLIVAWVPESPRWLVRMGRAEEARRSLAWALEMDPERISLESLRVPAAEPAHFFALFKYRRSLILSWFSELFAQTTSYGINSWVPMLFVLALGVTPAHASLLMFWVAVGGLVGRVAFSWFSELIGRRASGMLLGFGGAVFLTLAGVFHSVMLGGISVFWMLLICSHFFADGGFAIVGPYAAEVWPTKLRTTGFGAAYGFGGLGKLVGPAGVALIIGSSNVLSPQVTLAAINPIFLFLAGSGVLTGLTYLAFGFEVKGKTIELLDAQLDLQTTNQIPHVDALPVSK